MVTRSIEGGLIVVDGSALDCPKPDLPCASSDRLCVDSVGVLGPDNCWVLKPNWRDVLCERGGYFFVQDHSGRWGVVSPDGWSLTPFTFRQDKPEAHHSIEGQLSTQLFLWWQYRSMQWTIAAARAGSLAVFEGKQPVSYSNLTYLKPWGVDTEEPVAVLNTPSSQLDPDSKYLWRTSCGSYSHGLDTLQYCPITAVGSIGEPATPIPWYSVALALGEPETFDDWRLYERLSLKQHTDALSSLIERLVALADELHLSAITHSDKPYLEDSALDARIISEEMRGIVMNLQVMITIPRQSGELQSFVDLLPDALTTCAFRRLNENLPHWNTLETDLRDILGSTLHAYDEWESRFLGVIK